MARASAREAGADPSAALPGVRDALPAGVAVRLSGDLSGLRLARSTRHTQYALAARAGARLRPDAVADRSGLQRLALLHADPDPGCFDRGPAVRSLRLGVE